MASKKDYTGGDHSFKNWFKIMWKNGYIFLFLAFLAMTIAGTFFSERLDFDPNEYWNWFVAGFGLLGMTLIAYKGFWQFWNDLKNGRSR